MKMKNISVLFSAISAAILLSFSVSVFAEDQDPGGAPPGCNPGYEAVRIPDGTSVCAQSARPALDPVKLGESCESDSDCRTGEVCTSCSSFKNIPEQMCPEGEAVCAPASHK
jgi:hypothetical protein